MEPIIMIFLIVAIILSVFTIVVVIRDWLKEDKSSKTKKVKVAQNNNGIFGAEASIMPDYLNVK